MWLCVYSGLKGSGFDSNYDAGHDVDSSSLYKLHFSVLAVVAEVHHRFWVPYTCYPWVLAKLVDTRADRSDLVSQLHDSNANLTVDIG